jgi:hypothetical protein
MQEENVALVSMSFGLIGFDILFLVVDHFSPGNYSCTKRQAGDNASDNDLSARTHHNSTPCKMFAYNQLVPTPCKRTFCKE